eukprot:2522646-Rhodomonas_salina.2
MAYADCDSSLVFFLRVLLCARHSARRSMPIDHGLKRASRGKGKGGVGVGEERGGKRRED